MVIPLAIKAHIEKIRAELSISVDKGILHLPTLEDLCSSAALDKESTSAIVSHMIEEISQRITVSPDSKLNWITLKSISHQYPYSAPVQLACSEIAKDRRTMKKYLEQTLIAGHVSYYQFSPDTIEKIEENIPDSIGYQYVSVFQTMARMKAELQDFHQCARDDEDQAQISSIYTMLDDQFQHFEHDLLRNYSPELKFSKEILSDIFETPLRMELEYLQSSILYQTLRQGTIDTIKKAQQEIMSLEHCHTKLVPNLHRLSNPIETRLRSRIHWLNGTISRMIHSVAPIEPPPNLLSKFEKAYITDPSDSVAGVRSYVLELLEDHQPHVAYELTQHLLSSNIGDSEILYELNEKAFNILAI